MKERLKIKKYIQTIIASLMLTLVLAFLALLIDSSMVIGLLIAGPFMFGFIFSSIFIDEKE